MKVIVFILLYIGLTVGYYLLLSTIGLMFFDTDGTHLYYSDIIGNQSWFMGYLVLIHWWLVILSLSEYYNKYIRDLNF